MGLLDSVLKAFVGDKSKKDIGEIQPLVDAVKQHGGAMAKLSLDELRAKSDAFRAKIKEDQKEVQKQIDDLLKAAEVEEDIDEKENIYNQIDSLKDDRYEVEKASLNEILPEAFAVVKETAQRFKDNPTLTVTATPFDRELSADKDYVSLDGEKAVWKNSWDAAGKEVTWDMVHYDVQLIGGIALHQGKVDPSAILPKCLTQRQGGNSLPQGPVSVHNVDRS